MNPRLKEVRRERRQLDQRSGMWWKRWNAATANGAPSAMTRALKEVRSLGHLQGDGRSTTAETIEQRVKRRESGRYRGDSTRHLKEVLERSARLRYEDETDRKMLAAPRQASRADGWRAEPIGEIPPAGVRQRHLRGEGVSISSLHVLGFRT